MRFIEYFVNRHYCSSSPRWNRSLCRRLSFSRSLLCASYSRFLASLLPTTLLLTLQCITFFSLFSRSMVD
jgi:hypothetical protein